MVRGGLLLLLFAAPVCAQSITSFEPDTTRASSEDGRMVDTPIWSGVSVSMGSALAAGWDGFIDAPMHFTGLGLHATWPWQTKFQSWVEWRFMRRTLLDEYSYSAIGGVWRTVTREYSSNLFAIRTGVEHRIGARGRPWCAVGGGLGYSFSFDSGDEPGTEALARVTCFTYPSRHTRIGLMISGGPTWGISGPEGVRVEGGPLRTSYEVSLRFDTRIRFPRANAD